MKKMLLPLLVFTAGGGYATAEEMNFTLSLKQPGNPAVSYPLTKNGSSLTAATVLPLTMTCTMTPAEGDQRLVVKLKAHQRLYFNIGASMATDCPTDHCELYLPGFWYHKNLRSPREAPSFHTSKSWDFREDRLSSPLTGVYDSRTGRTLTVMRSLDKPADALTTHQEGEIILGGHTSVGYLGFDCESGFASLTFGYPWRETPRRYIRKLTLAPAATSFARLEPGEEIELSWLIRESRASDYGQFVTDTWNYCFDRIHPEPIEPLYTPGQMKAQLANYFRQSYVDRYALKYHSGSNLRCDDCRPSDHVTLGFVGRVLLNAFNCLEYGHLTGDAQLTAMGDAIFQSWLQHGLTARGYFKEDMRISQGLPSDADCVHTIRQQSEAVYAVLHYLNYEKLNGRRHRDWEQAMRTLLNQMLLLQQADGSFPRKYRDDHTPTDGSGGSTPSATPALIMGYKYFGDKRYLKSAQRTVDYLEQNIIGPSDYFSSTLDANCEDKEAAISAVTATYYLAMATAPRQRQHYVDLCRQAASFALSWYYLWDVPFAPGQMLGELGFRSRGWGNVSVENNHVDVFVFELPHILCWLTETTGEQRYLQASRIMETSLCQLLPVTGRLCGIALPGFYPEVVQHTHWDYGRNGKGFYNDIFAPGWTVASLWELYSPRRTADFLQGSRGQAHPRHSVDNTR